jgi:hypothetical protein
MITREYLQKHFYYRDGALYRKHKMAWLPAGSILGCQRKDGYWVCNLSKKNRYVHRLIYIYHYGDIPNSLHIDHIDTNPNNCKIENLRIANASENHQNTNLTILNKSGVKNVHWSKTNKKWCVQVKRKTIGHFDDLELAELVAIETRNKFYGEFANHG